MKKTLGSIPLLALAAMLAAAPAAAQQQHRNTADHDRRSVSLYMSVGGAMLDVDQLNGALGAQGYAPVSERFFTLGLGGHLVINQAIVGFQGTGLLAEQSASTNGVFSASLAGRYGMLDFGYLIYEGESLDLYPLLGVGFGQLTLDIVDRTGGTFDGVVADPRRGVELEKKGFLLGLSLGGDYVFEVGRGARRGPMIGIRAGYNYAPVEPEWSLDGTPLLSGPELTLTGPFVRILLGWGGRGPTLGR